MYELTKDISTITTIPKTSLDSLIDSAIICICHDALEDSLNDIDVCEIDIGLGNLYLKLDNDDIKFKFVPNLKFENILKESLNNKTSPLISKAELVLKAKVMKTYKDLL